MINSLSQDSHIIRGHRLFQSYPLGRRVEGRECLGATVNNQEIIAKKPAEISFCGFLNAGLTNDISLERLVKEARKFLGGSPKHKKVQELINKSVEVLVGKKQDSLSEVNTFLAAHREKIQKVIDKAEDLLTEENKKDPLNVQEMGEEIKKAIDTSVYDYPAKGSNWWVYKDERLKEFFRMADDSQAVFGATFALILTGLFRPAAIMALPSDKKNKDDKKYAAAHSVASGIIGYIASLIISAPIADAMKKLEENPKKFLKKETLKYLRSKKAAKAAQKYVNFLHEAVLAPPRAMITVALIPPILKYVFGWEKQKEKKAEIKSQALHGYATKNTNARTKTTFKMFMRDEK